MPSGRGLPSPRPEFIRDCVDMSAALRDLYEKAGSPPQRTMEQRAGNFGVLPRSTVHRIVTKQAMPHSKKQFQAYLRACEVPETDWPGWEVAWTRAWRHEKQDDFAARGAATASAPTPLRDIFDAAEAASKEFAHNMAGTRATSQQLREMARHWFDGTFPIPVGGSGEIMVARNGTPRRASEVMMSRDAMAPTAVQVKHRGHGRWLGRRVQGPTSRRVPEQPEQGQLAFYVTELSREPDALF